MKKITKANKRAKYRQRKLERELDSSFPENIMHTNLYSGKYLDDNLEEKEIVFNISFEKPTKGEKLCH